MKFKKGWSKGRTLEEIYGEEKAKEIKLKKSKNFSEGKMDNLIKASKKQGRERKGKTLEELYGKEKAEEIKKKIRKARATQKCPRTGKKHSDKSKEKMSKTREKLLKENPELIENQSKKVKQWWANMTKEERTILRSKYANRFLTYKRYKAHSLVVKITNWWTKKEVTCESSYEYYCFLQFNLQKIKWEKNTKIKIPYESPIDNEVHWYLPDFLIYDETRIIELGEIKPYEFAFNPDNKKTAYHILTKAKLEALRSKCRENNFKCRIITEEDIDLNIIKNNPIPHEDKKNYKKDLLRRKKSLLRKREQPKT